MITRLSYITLYVFDQEKAFTFYTQQMGFEVRSDIKNGDFRWLTVAPKGQPDFEIVLFELKEGGALSAEAVGHFRGLLENGLMSPYVFHTTDCYADYEELKTRGVEFFEAPTDNFYGIEANCRDPFGNLIKLIQPK